MYSSKKSIMIAASLVLLVLSASTSNAASIPISNLDQGYILSNTPKGVSGKWDNPLNRPGGWYVFETVPESEGGNIDGDKLDDLHFEFTVLEFLPARLGLTPLRFSLGTNLAGATVTTMRTTSTNPTPEAGPSGVVSEDERLSLGLGRGDWEVWVEGVDLIPSDFSFFNSFGSHQSDVGGFPVFDFPVKMATSDIGNISPFGASTTLQSNANDLPFPGFGPPRPSPQKYPFFPKGIAFEGVGETVFTVPEPNTLALLVFGLLSIRGMTTRTSKSRHR